MYDEILVATPNRTEEEFLLAFWKSSDERRQYSGVSDTGWTLSCLYINENKPKWHLNYTLTVAPSCHGRPKEKRREGREGLGRRDECLRKIVSAKSGDSWSLFEW